MSKKLDQNLEDVLRNYVLNPKYNYLDAIDEIKAAVLAEIKAHKSGWNYDEDHDFMRGYRNAINDVKNVLK